MRLRLLLLFLFFRFAAQAQNLPFFQSFTERNGLSDDNVQCILRDQTGYLWVGTTYGLNRFDGYTFRQYLPDARQPDRTVCHEIITDLEQDQVGFIWIATRNGLNRYDPRTDRFKTWRNTGREDHSLPNSLVTDLLSDTGDRLWLCCDNRDLTLFNTQDFTFSTFPWKAFAEQVLPEKATAGYKTIYRLARKSEQELWLYTNLGAFSFHTGTRTFFFHQEYQTYSETPDSIVHRDQTGLTWLGGQNGLHCFDPDLQHFRFKQVVSGKPNPDAYPFYRLIEASDGRQYANDLEGQQLFILEHGKVVHTIALSGASALLFEDSRGKIWVGAGNRLLLLNPKTWKLSPATIPKHLPHPGTASIFQDMAEDSQGNLWFATDDAGIWVWRVAQGVWWKPAEAEGFIGRNISCVFADWKRQTVWIGSQDYGLFRYDEKAGRFSIYQREESNPEHSLGAYIVNSICRDGLGYLWVATDPGGISRFDYNTPENKAFLTLNTQSGLPSNQVISVQTDKSGHIWVGTPKGLAWVDAKTLQVRTFDRNSGLANELIGTPIARNALGEMMLGGVQGFTVFQPDSVLKNKSDARILLTSFRIFEKEPDHLINPVFLKTLELSWKENFFVFEFATVNFSQAEKNTYAYRLSGFQEDWVDNGKLHRAAFTNVPPGDYVFEVKSGREGIWNAPGLRLNIHIRPPFWQTGWFITLACMALLSVVYLVWRYRIGQIRREAALKTEFNQRIAKVEMAALRAQMNPHFVFNCLSSINRFILVNEPDEASAYLTKFSRLIRLILDNSRSDKVPLDRELEALRLYIEMEAMRFGNRFDYEISVSGAVQPEQIELPPLLIQPYVENAIWHGLMHKKGKGKLLIQIFNEGNSLYIVVEDNGVGRNRAMELKSKSAVTQKSHGLQVTAERMELIRGLYGVHANATIEDLYTTDGLPAGTRVTIRLTG
jgi:ligand-binding sensor domain-containing protein